MNLSFLFWNLNKKPLWDRLASIIAKHEINIVMLAESAEDPVEVCRALTSRTQRRFHSASSPVHRLHILTSLEEGSLRPVFDDISGRLTIQRLLLPERRVDILVALTHLQSKLHWTDDDQLFTAMSLATDIAEQERRFDNHRTVLVGDFNMNPFEKGIVAAGGLHAVMTRAIAANAKRTVSSREYRYFYNPMWSYFGDRTDGPPGTYYYAKSTPVSYFWNVFDQVLLRPDIMHWLKDLRILDHDGSGTLLTPGGTPDSVMASDHLPLFFRLHPDR